IKSDALGITTEDFEAQKVDFENLYTGWRETHVPGAFIDRLYAEKQQKLELPDDEPALVANEFVLLKDHANEGHTAIARFRGDNTMLVPVRPRRGSVFGIIPRNLQQTMALELLLDDSIK